MQFVVASEQYVEFWRQPGVIQVGDFYVAISKKYADNSLTNFLGNTYTQLTVMESTDLGGGQFRIKASSDKRLDFLDKGFLLSMGLTEQIVTLSNNRIQSLEVVNSVSSIVGGTGILEKYENGLYTLKSIGDHLFLATISEKKRVKNGQELWLVLLLLAACILFLIIYFRQRVDPRLPG